MMRIPALWIAAVTIAFGQASPVVRTDSTSILTNKTLDVEATGNSVTTVERVYMVAAGCNNATASTAFDLPTSGAPTPVCLGTTTTSGYLGFVDAATSTATVHYRLPADWTSTGGVDLALIYTGSTSSTNNIRWQVSSACVADGEDLIAPSYNSATASSGAGPTTAGQRKTLSVTGLTVTNCAAAETMFLKIERLGSDAADTYTGDGRLMAVALTFRRAQ